MKLIAEKSDKAVYYYKFSYQGRYSHFYLPGSNDSVPYGKYQQKMYEKFHCFQIPIFFVNQLMHKNFLNKYFCSKLYDQQFVLYKKCC